MNKRKQVKWKWKEEAVRRHTCAQLTVCPTSATSINISRLSPANGQASVLFIAITQQSSRKPSVVTAARHDTPQSLTELSFSRKSLLRLLESEGK